MEFLDRVARVVSGRFPLVKLECNEADFSVSVNGNWTSLENLYRAVVQHPDQAQQSIERWITELIRAAEGSPDQSASFEEVRERIFPMVLWAGRRDVSGAAMVRQNVIEGLDVAYVLDSAQTVSYIPREAIDRWNVSLEQLHETAIENLTSRSDALAAHAGQDEQGNVNLILIQTMDGYDASRILLPALHDRLRQYLGSPFLAGVPNREILICFRDEPQTVANIRQQVEQDFKTMPHQVSPHLFLITPDGIAPYKPLSL